MRPFFFGMINNGHRVRSNLVHGQTERLERLYVETTSLEGMILPGSTVYYALVYKAPIIGVNQRVRIQVSHREAADAPVAVSLPTANSEKK